MFSSVSRPHGLRFDVSSQILLAIFRGQLSAGDRLVVKWMAQEFGVSATPAREALLELASLGVVELQPNRGAIVRQFGPVQLREIYALRALLEGEATRLACGRLDVSALLEFQEQTRQLTESARVDRWSENSIRLDRAIHDLIARGCGNERLTDEIHHYDKLVQIARSLLGDSSRLQQLAHQQHLNVLSALLKDDSAQAALAMKNHIDSAGDVLIAEVFHALPHNQVSEEKPSSLP